MRDFWKILSLFILVSMMVGCVSAATTSYFVSGTDVSLYRSGGNKTLSNLVTGAGTSNASTDTFVETRLGSDALTNNYSSMLRAAILWNTSSLPDDAIINSATLTLQSSAKLNEMGTIYYTVTGLTPSTQGTLVTADYSNHLNVHYCTDFIPTNNAATVITLTNLTPIDVDGWTNLSIRTVADVDNNESLVTWSYAGGNVDYERVKWGSSENTTASYRPNLSVTYTTTPTTSFTKSRTTIRYPQYVDLTDTSTNTPTGWAWYVDGSLVSTSQNTSVQITGSGTKTISLNASNAAGYDWYNDTIEVISGGGSHDQNPTHSYTKPGLYTVSLTACNIVECNSTTSTIWVQNPLYTLSTQLNSFMYSCEDMTYGVSLELSELDRNMTENKLIEICKSILFGG